MTALDQCQPPSPEIEELGQQIREVIRSKRPPDEDSLVEADPEEMARQAGGQLNGAIESDTNRVQSSYNELQSPPQGQPTQQPQAIESPPASVEAPPVDAQAAIPEPVPAENISLDADVEANQQRMDDAGMNSEPAQLVRSGPIAEARAAQGELEGMAERDPAEYWPNKWQHGIEPASIWQRWNSEHAGSGDGTRHFDNSDGHRPAEHGGHRVANAGSSWYRCPTNFSDDSNPGQ